MTKQQFLSCLCYTGQTITGIYEDIKTRYAGKESLSWRLNVARNSMNTHLSECVKCSTALQLLKNQAGVTQ